MITLLNPWKKKRKTARLILSAFLIGAIYKPSVASEGLYLGVAAGGSYMVGELKDLPTLKGQKVRKKGALASAFIGYNHAIKDTPMFAGVELGASNHPMKKTIDGTYTTYRQPYVLSLSTNNSLHGHLRVGFTVSNLSFYCKAGLAQTNFKTTLSAFQKDKATTFKKYGASTGFGVEAKINNNFILGIDHTYTEYGNLRNIEPDPTHTVNMRCIPQIHSTSLRLIYLF